MPSKSGYFGAAARTRHSLYTSSQMQPKPANLMTILKSVIILKKLKASKFKIRDILTRSFASLSHFFGIVSGQLICEFTRSG